ncbi:MAG: hypothetical protein OSB73_14280 [Candidatus Latescibacteria bacterium]|jgi:hypothetical protein|nr:hypothetical protein [Candidatus Latescibacterota bacterium]
MEAWVFTCSDSPLEHWLDGFETRFDAWEEGGVTGIVVGRMAFRQDDGSTIPAYAPDPEVYKALGAEVPAPSPRDLQKEKKLQAMLDNAAARGWRILIFSGVGSTAHVQDQMNTFPQVHGVIADGPGENHYELAFHHGGELLELRPGEEARFGQIGAEIDRLHRGIDHLRQRLHNLTPELVRYHADGGMLGSLLLFDINEDVLYWLRQRQERARFDWQYMRNQVDAVDRKVELGGIPRAVTWSSLTGQNYHQMAEYFDYIFPKHYFWHRGMDGMYGTISRWVKRLGKWNPTLTEADCFAVVKALLGIELPGINSLMDMEMGFPDEFFSKVVYNETKRALAAVGDPDKVIAWVSTGRSPHGGDQMQARDLHSILSASQQAGLKRFLYHPEPDFGAAEWTIISSLCGKQWDEDPNGYWPTETDKPGFWDGGRAEPAEGRI